jgi:SSS family solute:Na+ symporter/sodium/pantothenate symporter
MGETFLPWLLFLLYIVAIVGLTWWNRREAASMSSFAVGTRSLPPFLVGLSLAANMTSVATFVINPGLVHAFGWAGVVGYGIAAPLGIFVGLIVTSKRFRRVGDRVTALTVPQWVGERYGERRLTLFFAVVSLLQVSFVVLIVTGIALVLMSVLSLPMWVALAIVIGFTFAYILLGGASVHIWSNTMQATIMVVVAVLLLASGAEFFAGGVGAFFDRLAEVGPGYASLTNPSSLLFRDLFEVLVANFIIGLAIIMQPHLMSKALYLRSERDVNRYLATAMVVGTVFTSVLLVGLFARLSLGGSLAPDRVMATYIATDFSPPLRAVIMLGVLAAGFSTLEGVILALSTIVANDLYGSLARALGTAPEHVAARVLPVGRGFLVVLAPVVFLLARDQILDPSLSVAIFAQNGVYALFAATFAPVLFGMFSSRATKGLALAAALTALAVHFGMYYGQLTMYHNNPAVPAATAIVASTLVMAIGVAVGRARKAAGWVRQ